MELLIQSEQREGYLAIAGEKKGNTDKIDFGLLCLKEKKTFEGNTENKEVGLIILTGQCTIEGKGFQFADVGERRTVFSDKPYSVYLPCNTHFKIKTNSWAEIAVCKVSSDLKGVAKLIAPNDSIYESIGFLHWRVDRYLLMSPARNNTERLSIGELILPPGHATFPPHCHDMEEEIYFYRVRPPQGFGIQMVYTNDGSINKIYKIHQNDTVVVPNGFHPSVASPGNSLYVLWVMSPEPERRPLILHPDPQYAGTNSYELVAKEYSYGMK